MKTEQKDAINKQVSKPNCYCIARLRNDSIEEKRISSNKKENTQVKLASTILAKLSFLDQ